MEPQRRTWLWRAAAILLLLCATYSLVQWSATSGSEHAGEARSLTVADLVGTEVPPAADQPSRVRVPARPVAISIPAIGVSSSLVYLGLNGDGTVEVPTDPDLAGWYRLGTRPGAVGSAVILGHVDSLHGPAVFALLRTLRPGDRVDVRTADGTTVRFQVQSVRTYANARFPAQRVYAAKAGRSLNVITCGGEYDPAHGGYQANVVVHADWRATRYP